MKWLREVVSAHYWPDPLGAVLFDLFVALLIVFCVVAVIRLT